MVYSGSSTTGGQPALSPQSILDTLAQLDSMLKKLEQAVMDIMKDVDHKKKVSEWVTQSFLPLVTLLTRPFL